MEKESKATVLIVDDQPKNLQILGITLGQAGFKAIAAMNGILALKMAEQNQPDLILLDIMMPEMDGYTVCHHLKINPLTKDIPVIFLTAKTQPEDIIKGFEAGSIDYITKPFNAAELIKRVETHIELKTSRDIIKKQNEELKQHIQTKDKLFSIISHDLRGPLGSFITMLELIMSSDESFSHTERLEFLNLLYENANQSYMLLENLLNWARNQRGAIIFEPEKYSLNQIIKDIFDLYKSSADKKQIKLKNQLTSDLFVFADKNMINTIFRNLISNAIKFSNKEGTITIDAFQKENFITIIVRDQGIGIHSDVIQKLFDPFVHHTTYGTSNEKGSGLGLHLCREFVQRHGGKIWVESIPNQGSSFYFTLPVFHPNNSDNN